MLVPKVLPACLQVRGMLAELGYEKLDDIVGRTELLQSRNIKLQKTQLLDLSYLLQVCSIVVGRILIIWFQVG